MKILVMNYGIGGFAGDASQFMLLIKGLKKRGHQVSIITPDGNVFYFDKEKNKQYAPIRKKLLESKENKINIEGISVYPVHAITYRLGFYSPFASKILKKVIPEFDVVYAINWYYHLAMITPKICNEKGVPFIVAAYGSLQDKAKRNKQKQKQILDYIYTKKMIKTAGGFHSVGNLETKTYIKLGAEPKKIYHIDHGINLDDFIIKEKTNILKRLFGNEYHKKEYILNIGRIHPKKGVDLSLKVFSKILKDHPSLKYVIVGTGEEKYVKKIKDLCKELKIEKSVVFSGFVTNNEKLELLDSAKIFLVTSHSDVHTTTAIEAMAMGIPVVISKESDFPEIDEYNAGKTVDLNEKEIVDAVKSLLNNEERLNRCSKNARKLINDKFLLENQFEKYEKMFKDVISKNKILC